MGDGPASALPVDPANPDAAPASETIPAPSLVKESLLAAALMDPAEEAAKAAAAAEVQAQQEAAMAALDAKARAPAAPGEAPPVSHVINVLQRA